MNSIDSNIDITRNISKLTCLTEASPVQNFQTTRLQYRTLKLLCAICSILVKLFKKHSLYTGYKIRWTGGPLNCYRHSELLKELCEKIVKHSYILGEHFLKIGLISMRLSTCCTESTIPCGDTLWVTTRRTAETVASHKMSLCTLDLDSFQCHKWIAVSDIYLDLS